MEGALSTTPVIQTSKTNWPLFSLMGVLVLMAGIGIGLLVSSFLTPTPSTDPTANWKTYTNSKYNFTFKYPDNKRVVFDTIGYGVLRKPMVVSISLYSNGFQMPKFNTGFKGELTFSITVVPTPDNDIVNWVKEEGRLTWIYDARVKKSVMDNLPGYTFIKQKKGLNKLVVTNHNNNLFLINAYGESKYAINDVFDQILSTFKFLQTTPSGTPQSSSSLKVEWISFKNTGYGIEFDYPQGLTATQVHSKYINLIGNDPVLKGSIVMPMLILENPNNLLLIDLYINYLQSGTSRSELEKHLNVQPATVGNSSGIRIIQDEAYFQQSTPYTTYLIPIRGNSVLEIKTNEYSGVYDGTKTSPSVPISNISTYQKILSTFKFTN